MKMTKQTSLTQDQQGFASIVVALVVVIILALLSVGFAQLAQREQQNSLNKQLSSQAYYAAESGINDIKYAIFGKSPALINTGNLPPNSATQCLTPLKLTSLMPYSKGGTISNNISYSCALINLNPSNLAWGNIAANSSKSLVTNITNSVNPLLPVSLTVSWSSADNQTTFNRDPSSTNFPQRIGAGGWEPGGPPVIQFSVTPMGKLPPAPSPNYSRDDLINNTYTAYLYPYSNPDCSPGNILPNCSYANKASSPVPILSGGCNVNINPICSVTITNIPYVPGNNYVVHIISFYDNANVTVTGSVPGAAVNFTGQPLIDVTGKAHNVLKRVQVRISNQPTSPGDALSAQTCKREQTSPTTSTIFKDPSYNDATANDPCNLVNP